MISQEMERIARENAIKELKEFQIDIGSCQDDLDNSPLYYALGMAIKALEQTELNPSYNGVKTELKSCEDYISRTKLLARIDEERKHLLDIKMDGAEHVIVHHARRIIEDMPSITPKALEQQPGGDCISREATISLVHDLAQPCDDSLDWDISADEMIDGIKSLPSVTPTPLSENATNGDVIKAMFPNAQKFGTVLFDENERILFTNIKYDWWNAPYKAESEDEEWTTQM